MRQADPSNRPKPGRNSRRRGPLLEKTLDLLQRFGLRARKELGQNFLIDEEALEKILASADLKSDDVVVEVGPGLGILTEELAKRCGRLVAVEVDPKLVAILKQVLSGFSNVTIVEQDILKTEPGALLAGVLNKPPESIASGSYKVVSNLPYYITSMALRHFLEAEVKPSLMVLTIQKEVAERVTAKPGDLSLLAVSVQVYGHPEVVAVIPSRSFYPEPKVDSAVVRTDVYKKPAVDVDDMDTFFRLVQAGFSQPRKQLHNALSRGIWLPPDKADELLEEAGIDPKRRAQTLSLKDWERLYWAYKKFKESSD